MKLLELPWEEVIYTDDFVCKLEKQDIKAGHPYIMGQAYLKTEPNAKYKVILRIKDEQGKEICFPTNFGGVFEILKGTNYFSAVLPHGILCNGNLTINIILEKDGKYYTSKESKIVIKNVPVKKEPKLKVAFIGGINEEKGGKAVTRIIKQGGQTIEWYVIGGIGEAELEQLQKNNLVKTGYYHQEDLYTYLHYYQIDVVCILSKCPETFSYTLSEAILSHIPVIVTDIGALGQRVQKEQYGAIVSTDEEKTIDEVLELLNNWQDKEEAYRKVCKAVRDYRPISVQDMLAEYCKVYGAYSTMKSAAFISKEDLEYLYQAYMLGHSNYQGDKNLLARMSELENRLKVFDNSITFKIVLKLTSINFPFKQKLRAWLMK